MYTYIEEEQLLVTCDSFGSHYGFHDVLASKVDVYKRQGFRNEHGGNSPDDPDAVF